MFLTNQPALYVCRAAASRKADSGFMIRDIVVAKHNCGILSRADVKRYPASKGQSCSAASSAASWVSRRAGEEGSLSPATSDCRTAFHDRHSQRKKVKKQKRVQT
jgi:hypothetical protein